MISVHCLSPPPDAQRIALPFSIPAQISLLAAGDYGGRSATARERRRTFLDANHAWRPYARLDQRHTRSVSTIGSAGDGHVIGDGMVTAADVTLCVTVADCMPIFLYDPIRGVRGLLHSGWKGTGILIRAIRHMYRHFGSRPADLDVIMGPCIGSCCYRVDEARARLFAALWGPTAVVQREDAPYLDLRAANEASVSKLGLGRLRVVTDCTVCGGPFGSFRRDGPMQYTHMLAWL